MKKIKTKRITDKMRLDFMEKHEFQAEKDAAPYALDEKWIVGDKGAWSPTLRQAIDSAIRREKKR